MTTIVPTAVDDVACPVCKGTKTNSSSGHPCLCCQGVGTISQERDKVLAKIRKDLTQRFSFLIERTNNE